MKRLIDFKYFKFDFFGGITAGIVSLPLALAFGVSSGLGAAAGIYGAIFLCFFAALFGGTKTQISGPTAPMTAVSMVVIASVLAANNGVLSDALPIILGVFLIAGIIQILLGVLGVGKYVKYIPYSVISGFMSAIGVLIIITQLLAITGYEPIKDKDYVGQFTPQAKDVLEMKMLENASVDNKINIEKLIEIPSNISNITEEDIYQEAQRIAKSKSSGAIGTLSVLPRAIANINYIEFLMVISTLVLIFGFGKITQKVPSSLVAIIVIPLVAILFDIPYKSIQEIPSGLPDTNIEIFTQFNLDHFTPYLFTALMLAFLGAIDSLLTSVVADNLSKTRHQPNKELIGQGIGNSIAAFFGGIPGAGTTVTTVINIKSGGRTNLSGMVTGVFLLMIVFFLSPLASVIPTAVLSGILITVGVSVIDTRGIKEFSHIPKGEALIMVTVFILSIFWNLVYAVAIGVVIGSFLFVKIIGDLTEKKSDLSQLKKAKPKRFDFVEISDEIRKGIYVVELEGALFFGSTTSLDKFLDMIPEDSKTIIIDMHKMQYLGLSGVHVLEDFLQNFVEKKKKVLLVGIKQQPKHMMRRMEFIPKLVSYKYTFDSVSDCVAYLNKNN